MYKCICGFKSVSKATIGIHMQSCHAIMDKVDRSRGTANDLSSLSTYMLLDAFCDCVPDYSSYSDTSTYLETSSYSGGGGSFDGGGSSDSYDSGSCDSGSCGD